MRAVYQLPMHAVYPPRTWCWITAEYSATSQALQNSAWLGSVLVNFFLDKFQFVPVMHHNTHMIQACHQQSMRSTVPGKHLGHLGTA